MDKGTKPGDWGMAHRYTEIYEDFLHSKISEPLLILEIGVWKGGSLRMWEEYFPNAKIVGIDILPESASIETKRAKVQIGDASDPAFLLDVVDEHLGGSVDVVIDDGSHALEHQVVALESLFPRLNERGLYFVEDISVSRFDSRGVRTLPFRDFLDYACTLSELATFFAGCDSEIYHTIADIRFLSSRNQRIPKAEFWNLNLFALHIFHDMCVFERRARALPEGVHHADALAAPLRPVQGNAYASRRLLKSSDDRRTWSAAAQYTRSLDAAQESLLHGSVDIAVGRRLLEADGSVSEALKKLVTDHERIFSALRERMTEIRHDTDHLVEQYTGSQATLARALGRLNLREAELDRMRDSLEQVRLRPGTLEAELSAERTQNETLRAEIASGTAELEKIRTLWTQSREESTRAREELTKAQEDLARIRVETAEIREELNQVSTELAEARTRLSQAHAELTHAQDEQAQTKAALSQVRTEATQILEQLARTGVELVQKQKELDEDRAALNQVRRELDAIYRSRLWRMIRPLRAMDAFFRERRRRKKRRQTDA